MPDIERAAMNVWNSMREGINFVTAAFSRMGASWGLTWTSISDFALSVLAGIVVAFTNLPQTWGIVTIFLRRAWLEFMDTIKEPFSLVVGAVIAIWNNLPQTWNVVIGKLKVAWLTFTDEFKRTFGTAVADVARYLSRAFTMSAGENGIALAALLAPNTAALDAARAQANAGVDDLAARIRLTQGSIRIGWFGNLRPQIDALTTQLDGLVANFAAGTLMTANQWRAAMRQMSADAARVQ